MPICRWATHLRIPRRTTRDPSEDGSDPSNEILTNVVLKFNVILLQKNVLLLKYSYHSLRVPRKAYFIVISRAVFDSAIPVFEDELSVDDIADTGVIVITQLTLKRHGDGRRWD